MSRYLNLSWPQRARMRRLLCMEYLVHELADEIDCARSQIRRATELGCPHRTTESGRIYIVGAEFAAWYESLCVKRKRPLAEDEAFCLRCRVAVRVVGATVAESARGIERVTGRCARCSVTVNRYRRAV